MNYLNTIISKFPSVIGKASNEILKDWLTNTFLFRLQKDIAQLDAIDHSKYQEEKAKKLPVVCIGARIKQGYSHKTENILKSTNLMCIDIDDDNNPDIKDWGKLRDSVFELIPNIIYSGLSVSGHGVFFIVPIKHSDRFLEHWLYVKSLLSDSDILLDESKKNANALRYYAYDPNGKFRYDVEPLEGTKKEEPKKVIQRNKIQTYNGGEPIGAWYNKTENFINDLLFDDGWIETGRNNQGIYLIRPGKSSNSKTPSAVYYYNSNRMTFFTDNFSYSKYRDQFERLQATTSKCICKEPFSLIGELKFNGDFKAAARYLEQKYRSITF